MLNRKFLKLSRPTEVEINILYLKLIGANLGPYLTNLVGIHGTEYLSIAAAKNLLQKLKI